MMTPYVVTRYYRAPEVKILKIFPCSQHSLRIYILESYFAIPEVIVCIKLDYSATQDLE